MDRTNLIAELERFFAECEGDLVGVYLYGSFARGEDTAQSDVDIGLLFEEDPPASLSGPVSRIEAALEARLGIPVQAVVLNRAPVDLVHRVSRDGVLVLERNPSARVRFETKARQEYLDLRPILQLYRSAVRNDRAASEA